MPFYNLPTAGGSPVLAGSGVPSPSLGNNGDLYLDQAAARMYGPKANGSWGSGFSITGSAGPAASLSIGTVAEGDAAATITGTAPNQVLSLKIPRGATGATGATGGYTTVQVGSTTTAAAGSSASVQASTPSAGVVSLAFTIPRGADGSVNLADETPQPLGTASAGTALTASRADHTHSSPVVTYSSLLGIPSVFTPSAHQHPINDVTGLQAALDAKASLVNGTVPSSQLPSYVDDVIDVGGTLPSTGDVGKIYVVSTGTNANKVYRWSGSTFIEISPSPGTTTDVPEGANLYFTNARAVAAIPTASDTVAGIVKVGTGLSITGGVLSATGGGGSFAGTVDGGDYVGTIIGGGGGTTTDPMFSSVRLLINADLAPFGYDSSSNSWSVSSVGNAAATTTNPKFGARSLAFDGAGDYLRVVTGSSSFAFGAGDFTAEAWIWFPSLPASSNQYFSLFDTRSGSASAYGYAVFVNASGQLGANWGDTQNGATLLGGSLNAATWHHVALVRSAGTMRLYANGICVANTATNVSVNLSHNEVWISRSYTDGGGYYETSGLMGYWLGNIDDIRLTAAARYTGTSSTSTNYTVPTAAFPTS